MPQLSGLFQYIPLPGFFGTDSFTYWAVDGSGAGDIGTVTIEVTLPPMIPAGGGETGTGHVITPVSNSDDEYLTTTAVVNIVPIVAEESDGPGLTRRMRMDEQEPTLKDLDLWLVATDFDLDNLVGDRVDLVSQVIPNLSRKTLNAVSPAEAPLLESSYLQQLNQLARQFEGQLEFDTLSAIALGSAASAATAAYIIWTIRSGYMFAGMVASLPVWMRVDPLPVLNFNEVRNEKTSRRPNGSDNLLQTLLHESPALSGA